MYTTIIHPIRNAFNLSINEYCVLDSIYHLCNNQRYSGWCVASKGYIAKSLGLGESTVYTILNTLEAKELVERNDRGDIRTLDLWNEMIANKEDYIVGFTGKESRFLNGKVLQKAKKAVSTPEGRATLQKQEGVLQNREGGLQKLESDTPESRDNNNIYLHNNNKDKRETPASKMRRFIESVKNRDNQYQDLLANLYGSGSKGLNYSAELDKFVNYWTELNKSGTKQRWELQSTFEVQRRLSTWFSRAGGGVSKKLNIINKIS